MHRSVLRLDDQRAGRLPDVCVLSGVATQNAARVRAIAWRGRRWLLFVPGLVSVVALLMRRSSVVVSLPVSAAVWTRWRRRVLVGQAAVTFGLVLVGASIIGRQLPPGVLGAWCLIGAFVLWARANRNWWVTCRYDPAASVVVVEPTHREFDGAARALFVRSVR